MRITSRKIGAAGALVGLVFLADLLLYLIGGFERISIFGVPGSEIAMSIAITILVVPALGFYAFWWRQFRSEIDHVPDEPRFAPYCLAHRPELKVITQIGLAISLTRWGAVRFGVDWPGPLVDWTLIFALFGLVMIEGQIVATGAQLHWERVPTWMRPVLKVIVKAGGGGTFLILGVLFAWSQHSQAGGSREILGLGFTPLFYAWEALFFAYGEVRAGHPVS